MLIQLDINNIALIDKVSLDLGTGLNILTGETGAGKSIIIDSINSILGERISKDLIRTGKEKAMVEAVFQVDTERLADIYESIGIEPEEDNTLIISREFSLSGKNVSRVNGKMVTVSILKEIGERIIDIHGQYDNQSLLRIESHIELLDSFGGDKIQILKQEYSELLYKYKEIKRKLKELSGDKKERERKIDLLRFQVDEIKKARLKPSEEEDLVKQRLLLTSSEKIVNVLVNSYELLYSGNNIKNSASDNINEAVSELNTITKLDDKFGNIAKKLEEVSFQLDDLIDEIRKERDNVEYNPDLLEQLEERIDLIFKMKRKYGNTIGEILEYCNNIEQELEEIYKSEETVTLLREKQQLLNNQLYDVARKLGNERIKAANLLESKVCSELDELEMKKARFKVNIEFDNFADDSGERKYNLNGLNKIEFLISPNAGEPLKSLSKIASGGEMSRIMLAVKTILADVDRIPTLIFDEIDIGVSGRAAQKVGEKLSYLSRKHQVICVTHLAQIASMADNHYLIEKNSIHDSTVTSVKKLQNNEIKKEIARILGGADITEITIKHAEEILVNAKKYKNISS